MRTKIKIAAMTFALGLSTWALVAQDAGGPPPGDAGPPPGQGPGSSDGTRGGRFHRHVPPIVAALDANHDGIIDASEIANASNALKSLDNNGEGKLTIEELMGPRPGGDGNGPPPDEQGARPRPPLPLVFQALDTNHDGVIDASEIANASNALKSLDKNGDGQLTLLELMGPRPHPRPAGPGGRGDDPGGQGRPSGPGSNDGALPPPPNQN